MSKPNTISGGNESCRICQEKTVEKIWKIVDSAHGDAFKSKKSDAINELSNSLSLGLCKKCTLLQLLETIDLNYQYDSYLYKTSTTNALSDYYRELTSSLIFNYQLTKNELILDIGSNDGTFLKFFKAQGYRVLGIEPSKPTAEEANLNEIHTINAFFDENLIPTLKDLNKISLIAVNYTIANVPNLKKFFDNITTIMEDNTLLSIVTGYHPDQFSINMFDYVGHDHLSYLSLSSIKGLCDNFGLKIINVERIEHKGGSIHILISKINSTYQSNSNVKQLLQREKWLEISSTEYYIQFQNRIKNNVKIIREYVDKLNGVSFLGVGASISTSYLLKMLDIGERISFLFDDDSNKIGKFSPNYGIEVKPLTDINKFNGMPVLLLAWQHTDKLLERLAECGYKGKIVIPFPKLLVID